MPWSTKHWVVTAALGFGLAGLMLKVTDVGPGGSTPEPEKRAARPETRAGEEARHPGRAEAPPPASHDPEAPAMEPQPAPGDIAALPSGRSGLYPQPESKRVGPNGEPSPRERKSRRARKWKRRDAPSLEAGAVGDGPAAPGGTGRGAGSARAGASTPGTPGTPDQRAQAEQAAAPQPAVFDSGEEAYTTASQVEVPEIGKIASGSGTLSFWVQPQWADGNQDDATLLEVGDGRLQVVKNVNFLRFEFVDDAGTPGGLGVPITEWKLGEWHQVTTTWNGNTFSLYVDGQLVSQTVQHGPFQLPPEAALRIGSNYPASRPVAPGYIGRIDVRGRPLGPNEIARRYTSVTGQPPTPR